jgi:glycolate oxidase
VAYKEAGNRAEAEELWSVRRKCSGAMFELGDAKLNEDIVIPMRNYERPLRRSSNDFAPRSSRLPIPTFGHLADGNLHVNIMYHAADRAEYRRAERTVGQPHEVKW